MSLETRSVEGGSDGAAPDHHFWGQRWKNGNDVTGVILDIGRDC